MKNWKGNILKELSISINILSIILNICIIQSLITKPFHIPYFGTNRVHRYEQHNQINQQPNKPYYINNYLKILQKC